MTRVKNKLERLGVRPRKSRGQNFLIDPFVPKAICEFAQLTPEQHPAVQPVVEIGPGLGALTAELAFVPKLHLIEIETAFAAELRLKFPHAHLVEADVRQVCFSELGTDLVVVGNLPYSLSTEIVLHILKQWQVLNRAVFLLQREFAERLAAGPGGRDYGRLSVMRSLFAHAKLGPILGPELFHPRPAVDSQLIELNFFDNPLIEEGKLNGVERVVQAAFSQRRKTILNSLKGSGMYKLENVRDSLQILGIAATQRAETIAPLKYVELADLLSKTA